MNEGDWYNVAGERERLRLCGQKLVALIKPARHEVRVRRSPRKALGEISGQSSASVNLFFPILFLGFLFLSRKRAARNF